MIFGSLCLNTGIAIGDINILGWVATQWMYFIFGVLGGIISSMDFDKKRVTPKDND